MGTEVPTPGQRLLSATVGLGVSLAQHDAGVYTILLMIAQIAQHEAALAELCRRYGVRRLELVGSAADGTFDEQHSDIDFVVEFDACADRDGFEQYFDLLLELESLLGRPVDLIEPGAVRNPYFRQSLRASGQVLYDAA